MLMMGDGDDFAANGGADDDADEEAQKRCLNKNKRRLKQR